MATKSDHVLYPTVFHSSTHCIVCGATYETCICSSEYLHDDDDNSWDLDTYDGMYDDEEVYTTKG